MSKNIRKKNYLIRKYQDFFCSIYLINLNKIKKFLEILKEENIKKRKNSDKFFFLCFVKKSKLFL